MKFIIGQDRSQTHLFPLSLDQAIDPDNEVRLIDLFVDSMVLEDFGFDKQFVENGRPGYHPSDLLKLYIYGYLNKTRSSRDLEKESKRNIEVMWLLRCLHPDHNTISNFRRDNPKAIKKVFRETVRIAKHFNLIGGKLLAGDSSKFRAQNSKKNNFNKKKIERHVAYIDNKLDEYNKQLAKEDGDNKDRIQKEIEKHNHRKDKYKDLDNQLTESGESQVSTSDPESRQMMVRNNITEVTYNVQTSVDEKNCIPVDYEVTNTNDRKAMGNMLRRAKSILHTNEFTALYDKGYHTGRQLDIAERLGIETLVAVPAIPRSSQAPDPAYNVEHFKYSYQNNTYTCPQGSTLKTNGAWHQRPNYKFQLFKTPDCKNCPARPKCTKSVHNIKTIQRSEFMPAIERNRERVKEKKDEYRKRQAIVEHPYGTIKRQWGFSYIITKKGKNRASADIGLIFTAYNLRRIINILGFKTMRDYLKALAFSYQGIFQQIWLSIIRFKARKFLNSFYPTSSERVLNLLIFNPIFTKLIAF